MYLDIAKFSIGWEKAEIGLKSLLAENQWPRVTVKNITETLRVPWIKEVWETDVLFREKKTPKHELVLIFNGIF